MIDPKLLRQHLDEVAKNLQRRGYMLDVKTLTALETQRKEVEVQTQELQNKKNIQCKNIGLAKSKGEDVTQILKDVNEIGSALEVYEAKLSEIQQKLDDIYYTIPNMLHDSVPDGSCEKDNQVVRTWGDIPEFDFEPKDHSEVGIGLAGMDFEAATKISGSRFVVLYDGIAKLHRALAQFMLDLHTQEHGYKETYVPYLVKHKSLYGTGQLPKFWDDQFNIAGEAWDLSLIPTAEVPITNLVRETLVDFNDLPLKFTAQTPCFRSEAGSYGKDTKGMIRQHQFEKVEIVQVVHPDKSYDALEELTGHAETVLQKLGLPYRVVALCGGDIGFSAAKTYDLEVWLPSQNMYREISSCSNFESFQARRMSARFKDPATKKNHYLHTINGSALAVGRTLVAVLENYQQQDGTVVIPEVLRPYMNGLERLG